jgi:D-cysteine desulfhydrase
VYTGKGYNGMLEYLKDEGIQGKNVLFILTGSIPLFFDYAKFFL